MRVLRALGGSLLLIVTGVVGLLGVLLSVTVILLPVGIPLLMLARKLFGFSMTLFLPRAVRHPAQELRKKGGKSASDAAGSLGLSRKARKRTGKKVRKRGRKLGKKGRKVLARQS